MASPHGSARMAPRGGARRGARPRRTVQPKLLLLGAGAFVALLAWGGLVWLAIGFGSDARGGQTGRWALLAGASLAAVGALFVCLLLVTLVLRRVGIMEDDRPHRH